MINLGATGSQRKKVLIWKLLWPYLCLRFAVTILIAVRTRREKRDQKHRGLLGDYIIFIYLK